jgi:AGZA family xanthine/uracil permease-like MFS transporter
MRNIFKLQEHSTNVRTEITAGMTTFMAMLYIIPVNASILSASGMPYDALVTATIVMSIFASVYGYTSYRWASCVFRFVITVRFIYSSL